MRKLVFLLALTSQIANAALVAINPLSYLAYPAKFPGRFMASSYEIGSFSEGVEPINQYDIVSTFQTSPGAAILVNPATNMPAILPYGTVVGSLMRSLVWTQNWSYEVSGSGNFWHNGIFAFRSSQNQYGYANLSVSRSYYEGMHVVQVIDFGQFQTTANIPIRIVPETNSMILTGLAGGLLLVRRRRSDVASQRFIVLSPVVRIAPMINDTGVGKSSHQDS